MSTNREISGVEEPHPLDLARSGRSLNSEEEIHPIDIERGLARSVTEPDLPLMQTSATRKRRGNIGGQI